MKASAFRRWPVAGAYSPEQTTRLTGGSDFILSHTGLKEGGSESVLISGLYCVREGFLI